MENTIPKREKNKKTEKQRTAKTQKPENPKNQKPEKLRLTPELFRFSYEGGEIVSSSTIRKIQY